MNKEYKILNALVKNGGSMQLAALLNAVDKRAKRGVYFRNIIRSLTRLHFLTEDSQIVSLTDTGYARHAVLKDAHISEMHYRIGEWIRWGITTIIALAALIRTFL